MITQAGMAALIEARGNGYNRLPITHIGVGMAAFLPTEQVTAADVAGTEVLRTGIAGYVRLLPDTYQILANLKLADTTQNYSIGSIFVYSNDLLFGVSSEPGVELFTLAGDITFSVAVAIKLSNNCADAMQIMVDEDASATLALIAEYIQEVSDLAQALDLHKHQWNDIGGKPLTYPPEPHDHTWLSILNKPLTFMPSAHRHVIGDIDNLSLDWAAIQNKPLTFTPSAHRHAMSDIDNLSLDWAAIQNKPLTFTPSAHKHPIDDVTGLQGALDGKSNTNHAHTWDLIQGKPATFTPSDHPHQIEIDAGRIRVVGGEWKTLPTSSGAQGAQGAQGQSGAQGAQGAMGRDGNTGAQGATGATGYGTTGAQGAQGAPGQDATGGSGNWATVDHDHNGVYVKCDSGANNIGTFGLYKNGGASMAGGEAVSGSKLYPACIAMDGTVTAQSGPMNVGTWRCITQCLANNAGQFQRFM